MEYKDFDADENGQFDLFEEKKLIRAVSPQADATAAVSAPQAPDTQISEMTKGIPADPDTMPAGQTQWHLVGAWGLHADQVWNDYTGAGIMVGVMDDGFQYTHSELVANYRQDLDFDAFRNDATPTPDITAENHGTSVIGTIIADDNGSGGVGVAFDAQGYGIRIDLHGQGGTLDQIIAGYQHALNTGLDVMNNSWGFTLPFSDTTSVDFAGQDFNDLRNIMRDLVEDGRGGLGSNIVFAAGNARADGDNVNYHNMLNTPYVIAVAAIDSDGTASSFSTQGAALLVSAGGTQVYTVDRSGSAGYSVSDYTNFSGTSAAAPIVSGMIAVMLEANEDLGWRDVQEIIAYSAQHNDTGGGTWQYNGASNWNGGGLHFSHDYGFGAADLFRAVRLAETWDLHQTSANMTTTASVSATPGTAIPTTGTITSTINIAQNVDIETVVVHLDIAHARAGDLVVTLISPDGTESILINRPVNGTFTADTYGNTGIDFETMSRAHLGESSQGAWTLRVADLAAGTGGTLNSWNISFTGNAPAVNDTYIYTSDFGNFAGAELAARATLADTDGGNDTINLATLTTDTTLDMNAGASSTIAGQTLNIDAGTTIERAYLGDGDDSVTGNAADNYIYGGRGADTLDGAGGTDTAGYLESIANFVFSFINAVTVEITTVVGELWTDIVTNFERFMFGDTTYTRAELESYAGGAAPQTLTGTAGNDTLMGSGGDDTISGAGGNDALHGNGGNDTLQGDAGIDTLYGGNGDDILTGGIGNDTMEGGAGNDTYNVDSALDVVTELADEGIDLVRSSVTVTLSDNVENLTLTGAAAIGGTGNALDNIIVGNAAANIMAGGAGNDTLNGMAGADRMSGGAGDDSYTVDNIGDIITEVAGEGDDSVESSVTYTLSAGVEKLTLTGISALNGTGNAGDNILIGNSAANVLNGMAGADTMMGGAGNDTYVVDNALDVVTENAAEGTDLIQSSVTYTLSENVENLTLTGSAAANATGNALNNILTGNSGANVFDGGAGTDTMIGGLGNDTYMMDSLSEVVTEAAGAGTDTVMIGMTYTLGLNLENLVLTGSGAINGTGNTAANVITGNAAANILNGMTGGDKMIGGDGNDTYYVDNALDVITENADEGTDLIYTSVTYVMSANVENIILTGSLALQATGNDLANVMTGNASSNVLRGGAGNDIIDGAAGGDAMYGGLGDDYFYVNNPTDTVTESAGEGTDTVQASIGFILGANIENLILTGAVAINGTGNAADNTLTGNSGANVLNGMAGTDTMIGGLGNDTYVVDSTGDAVTENGGEGTDLVQASATFTLSANVENLTLTGTASIDGTGNTLNNIIIGNNGANVLDGGAGNDKMTGGLGNDTYVVDSTLDIITENAGAGTDTVRAGVNWTLAVNFENLTLTGAAAINATGNTVANVLTGNAAANVLNGGLGADTMAGGAGNDTYVVDNVLDIVTENASEGTDLVQSAVTYALADNIENLTLTGAAAVNGTGNGLDNVLNGNSGNNILNGGLGADTMTGGLGNDTYNVDDVGDIVTEAVSGGTDTVNAGVSYALGANVENLNLTGSGGINATGNALVNIINGNAGANIIDGGAGADRMAGGAGDDTYFVDVTGDIVTELAGGGTDTVNAGVTHVLGLNVENLNLTGAAAINGTGNGLDNVIVGNSGNNMLTGGFGNDTLRGGAGNDRLQADAGNDRLEGGAGADTLLGGAGADRFVFGEDAVGSIDVISDFKIAEGDVIDLSDVLEAYDPLTDVLSNFVEITQSGTSSILKVDLDGAGTAYGFTQIATLTATTGLTNEDLLVTNGTLVVS